MSSSEPAKRIFVSHSHADNDFSRKLVQSLSDVDIDVWYDERKLGAGTLAQNIEQALLAADSYIVILSPAAVASPWVQMEWYAALELYRESKIRFIPVIVEDCEIPLLLRGMHRVEFHRETYAQAFAHLLRLLNVNTTTSLPGQGGTTTGTLRHWEQVAMINAHARGVYAVDWSHDSHYIATGSYDCTVALWNAHTYQQERILSGHTKGVDAIAWSPDSKILASASLGPGIRIWEVASGQQREILKEHADGVSDLAWSPDGRLLASSSSDGTVRVWDPDNGQCVQVLRGHTAPVTSVDWSPDGRHLGSTSRDATVRIWDTHTASQVYLLTGHNIVTYCVRWSPDGKLLATSGHTTVRLWNAQTGELRSIFTGHTGHVLRVAWHPDGQLLASCSADKTVRLWDVPGQKAAIGCMISPGRPTARCWLRAPACKTAQCACGEHFEALATPCMI